MWLQAVQVEPGPFWTRDQKHNRNPISFPHSSIYTLQAPSIHPPSLTIPSFHYNSLSTLPIFILCTLSFRLSLCSLSTPTNNQQLHQFTVSHDRLLHFISATESNRVVHDLTVSCHIIYETECAGTAAIFHSCIVVRKREQRKRIFQLLRFRMPVISRSWLGCHIKSIQRRPEAISQLWETRN